jgi:TetR/AcrR family transcriptional regulator, repressor for neighboring sulfatase
MADEVQEHERRGREATTAAMLDAAEELFSSRGFSAVTVRDIAERAGVSHALVHRYIGSKEEIYRSVLERGESGILRAAPGDPDILESARLMLREALGEHRRYVRLIAHSALHGLSYDRTSGKFAATERLIELAERAAASATPAERAEKDIDPRLVVACAVTLLLGWSATGAWVLPAAGLEDLDENEAAAGLKRVVLGILRENLAGLGGSGPQSG